MRQIKKISILLIAILAISCSKDNEQIKEPSLKNTVWEGINDVANVTVTFYDTDATMILEHITAPLARSGAYTYTYAHPIVVMNPNDTDNAVLKGTIGGGKMILENTSSKEVIATLRNTVK